MRTIVSRIWKQNYFVGNTGAFLFISRSPCIPNWSLIPAFLKDRRKIPNSIFQGLQDYNRCKVTKKLINVIMWQVISGEMIGHILLVQLKTLMLSRKTTGLLMPAVVTLGKVSSIWLTLSFTASIWCFVFRYEKKKISEICPLDPFLLDQDQ